MDPDEEMGVVEILLTSSTAVDPVTEYLKLAIMGDAEAFQGEMGQYPSGITAGESIFEARSPLHLSAQHGNLEVLKLLMASPELSSLDVNARDRFGYTPLHLAARSGHAEVVRLLSTSPLTRILSASSSEQDEEGHDCDGFTPLHVAAGTGNIAVVKLLLREFEPALNIHATNWQGKTALDIAKGRNHVQLVELLECWDVKWLQLERQKSANSVNAILVGAALVTTVTFGSLLQPPLGIPADSGSELDLSSAETFRRERVEWFLVFTVFSFSFSIVSLVIGTTAVIPYTRASLKREVQQLRSAVFQSSISLFVAIFFLVWASQIGGHLVANDVAIGSAVNIVTVIVFFWFPIMVLVFLSRHIILPKAKTTLSAWVKGLFFVAAFGLNWGIYLGIQRFSTQPP